MAKPTLPLIDPELFGGVDVEATVELVKKETVHDRSVLREGFHKVGDEVKDGAKKLFDLLAEEDDDKGLVASILSVK